MDHRTATELTLLVSRGKLPPTGTTPDLGISARIERQLDQLERAQIGRPLDQRLQSQIVALNNPGVRGLLQQKLAEGLIFRGVICVPAPNVPEHRHILFRFEPAPNGFCMVPPSFLVVVDLFQEQVVSQVDSYVEAPQSERRVDECESAESSGSLEMVVVAKESDAVRVDVMVRAELKVGWPVSDLVRFEHHQEVTLRAGESIKLVETESGCAEIRLGSDGDLTLSAQISKWGLSREWERVLRIA